MWNVSFSAILIISQLFVWAIFVYCCYLKCLCVCGVESSGPSFFRDDWWVWTGASHGGGGSIYIYIYIYAFSRRFYPKRLSLYSSYSFYIFYQVLLSLGIEPMILALLAPCSTSWATGKQHSFDFRPVGLGYVLFSVHLSRFLFLSPSLLVSSFVRTLVNKTEWHI